jgi:hypothetical protein
MPIDVTIKTARGDTVVTVFNDAPEQDFKIPVVSKPTGIILDEEGWILKKVESVPKIPIEFSLYQNYPNPFNGKTIIEFDLPKSEPVEIMVYNIDGQQVRKLISQPYDAGTHKVLWEGRDDDGVLTASGLYIYQIRAGNFRQQKKMLFIK